MHQFKFTATVRLGFLALAVLFPGTSNLSAQKVFASTDATAPVELYLSKDQLSGLDKDAKNNYKWCSEGHKVSTGDMARACVDFGHKFDSAGKDPSVALLAFKRGCALGSASGCAAVGDTVAANGDVARAREVWSTGICANDSGCQHELFYSYASSAPPDLAMSVKYGVPLCDQGHDDKVCDQLKAINAPVDFAAIAENHRQQHIADLQNRIGKNVLAIPLLQAQVALCQANVNMQSGLSGLIAQGELKLAQKELSNAQQQGVSMQAELDRLLSSEAAPQ